MHRLVSPLLTALFLALLISPVSAQSGCGQPVAVDGATLISGDGRLNTRPVELPAGAHTVRYSASKTGQFGGNLIIALKPANGDVLRQQMLANTILDAGTPEISAETHVYGLTAGSYYFDVMAPGPWEISIAPQR